MFIKLVWGIEKCSDKPDAQFAYQRKLLATGGNLQKPMRENEWIIYKLWNEAQKLCGDTQNDGVGDSS